MEIWTPFSDAATPALTNICRELHSLMIKKAADLLIQPCLYKSIDRYRISEF